MKKTNEPQANCLLQLVEVDNNCFAIEQRNENLAVNLTAMAKPFGKKVSAWLRQESTQEYLSAISSMRGIHTSADLLEVGKGGTPENQGAWCYDHRIAQWLDLVFAVKVDTLILNILTGKTGLVSKEENQSNRLDKDRLIRLLTLTNQVEDNEIQIAITNELTGGLHYGNVL